MRFASVIAALTRAIQPNTDFHKHGDTSIVFAARDLPVHPLLPRAPNYLPMGAHLLPRPIPSIRIPLICRSSAPHTCSNDAEDRPGNTRSPDYIK